MSNATRERIVQFGHHDGLVGILTVSRAAPVRLPCIVIVNAGIIHRVGPNRLYVDVARATAALGYPVLRFDIAGLGDSDSMVNGLSLTELAQNDITTALDYLEQTHGYRDFIVLGLCSGANYGMLATFRETRVVGAMLIDPTVMRTRHGQLLHLTRRLLHAPTWGAVLSFRHPWLRRSLRLKRSVDVARAAQGQSGERADVSAGDQSMRSVSNLLQQSLDRGVRLMLVFTGGVNHMYNYREQLFDLLPDINFRDQLRLEYMPETDHTVCDGPSRATLLEAIGDWLRQSFPAKTSVAVADHPLAQDAHDDADTDLVIE